MKEQEDYNQKMAHAYVKWCEAKASIASQSEDSYIRISESALEDLAGMLGWLAEQADKVKRERDTLKAEVERLIAALAEKTQPLDDAFHEGRKEVEAERDRYREVLEDAAKVFAFWSLEELPDDPDDLDEWNTKIREMHAEAERLSIEIPQALQDTAPKEEDTDPSQMEKDNDKNHR